MASSKSNRLGASAGRSRLRIIGGQWRGRKLTFTPAEGLRPTADRVRETLFNWLAPVISGARCVDLFAGSGALGLEALSRGAAYCDFVDVSKAAGQQIAGHLETLDASERGRCHHCEASEYLLDYDGSLDIVFIDPPFNRGLVLPSCQQLSASRMLAPEAFVYIETPTQEAITELPPGWEIYRQKTAGGVSYRLYTQGSH
jgi:16S rRNA (guanine966-N2)-methyltransferase